MAMFLKAVCGVWKCLFSFLSNICKVKKNYSSTSLSKGNDLQSEEWEDFTIAVIPNVDRCAEVGSLEARCVGGSAKDEDIFRDMQPVIKKPKKISVQLNENSTKKLDFAVQDGLQHDLGVPGELGSWNEGSGGQELGWEEELLTVEDHVVQESKVAIKEKRRKEREFRRHTQDALRAQQKTLTSSNLFLGIKTNKT